MSEGMMPPGFSLPAAIRFIELGRPMLLGDTYCAAGDVVEVQPAAAKPRSIMPVDPRLYLDRAQKLVDGKLARAHGGPATIELARSIRGPADSTGAAVERAVNPAAAKAERATRAPQRGAM